MAPAGHYAGLVAPAHAGDDSAQNGSEEEHSAEHSEKTDAGLSEGETGGETGGDGDNDDDDRKLDDVRDAVRSKSLLPLWMVKSGVIARFGKQIIDTQIEKKNDRWTYEFKIISRHGHLIDVYVDASTGDILEVKND